MGVTDLPAGFSWKARDLHTMNSASWTRGSAFLGSKGITLTSTAGELDGQTFAHEVGTVEGCPSLELICQKGYGPYLERHPVHPKHLCTR